MKTYEDWVKSWPEDDPDVWLPEADVKAIQQDAYRAGLFRAAELCRSVSAHEPNGGTRHIMSVNLAEAIESEASKSSL